MGRSGNAGRTALVTGNALTRLLAAELAGGFFRDGQPVPW